jgi:hypothetical protein
VSCAPLQWKEPEVRYSPPPPEAPDEDDISIQETAKPRPVEIKLVKVKAHQLPRGFSSVLVVCVYLPIFGRNTTQQSAAVWRIVNIVEQSVKCSSIGNRPLIFIGGDFNGADHSPICRALKVHKLNAGSTHTKGGELDILLTNAPRCYSIDTASPLVSYKGVLSDHKTIIALPTEANYIAQLPPPVRKLVRSGCIGDTVNCLRIVDWIPYIERAKVDPQSAADGFYEAIELALDTCQPLKHLKIRGDQPWMTHEIKELINKRQRLLRKKKHAEYTEVAKKVSKAIYIRKRIYYRRKFSAKNPRWWSLVNDTRNQRQDAIADKELANELNDGFHAVWGDTAQPNLSEFTNIDCAPPANPIFNPTNITNSINIMDSSSPGPDGVSANLLKAARLELCFVLAALFNIFLAAGFVPTQWLSANITPLAKVDHPTSWGDYRPISLTSNICKIFERVIAKYIINTTSNIWTSNKQHGFLPGRGTMDAITQVLFDIGRAVDRGESVLAIFFDFAKAFDLVPHDKLLAKLAFLLPPWLVRWTAAYLSGRKQRVKINNFEAEWKKVEAGVVQGSVLGPILFIIYIADINQYILERCPGARFEKYADDIIAYIIGKADLSSLPQKVADAVKQWCDDNLMRLNAGKCKILHFASARNEPKPTIKIDNTTLDIVKSYKYLGIHITDSLDSNEQWTQIESDIKSKIYLLKQLKSSGLEEQILVSVFRSLVLSHFRYSSVVLDSCTQLTKGKMQVVQNRMLRSIGIKRQEALEKYNIVDIDEFIKTARYLQVSKILSSETHSLPISLRRNLPSHHNAFPFTIPRTYKKPFHESAVMKTLREMRDSDEFKSRAEPLVIAVKEDGVYCPNCGKGPFVCLGKHAWRCKGQKESK